MTVFGIDPGTATTGYGVVKNSRGNSLECVSYGCITTPKEKTTGDRLVTLEKELTHALNEYKPDVVGVERLYFFKYLKSAIPVSEARGVILLAIAKKKLPVFELTPLQVKMAITGYGRADKKQMQRMVQQTLKLLRVPKPDDAADALGLAIAGIFLLKKEKNLATRF